MNCTRVKCNRYFRPVEEKSLFEGVKQILTFHRPKMSIPNISNRVQILKQKFTNSVGLPFRDLLPESTIRKSLQELKIKYRQRLFDPFVTMKGISISGFGYG